MPKEAQEAMRALDPTGTGEYPKWRGHVVAEVTRELGPNHPFDVKVTIDLTDAAGTFAGFPYPLEHVNGRLIVGMDYITISHCKATQGDASVELDGRITWGKGKPVTPDVQIIARNVPIDATLMNAIAPERRAWLEKLGVSGKLDVDGHVFFKPAAPPLAAVASVEGTAVATTGPTTHPAGEIDVALDMRVHHGALQPSGTNYAVTALNGGLRLADGQVTLTDFRGKRGDANLTVSGNVGWTEGQPALALIGSAKNLLLEPALYQMLPKDAQRAWDDMRPSGTVDVRLSYGTPPAAADAAAGSTTRPTTQPTYEVALTPNHLAVTPRSLPYSMSELTGSIVVTPGGAAIHEVIGRHGKAGIRVNGTCDIDSNGNRNSQLQVTASDVPVDEDLLRALPRGLSDLMRSMKFTGKLAVDFPTVSYRPAANGISDGDLDLAGNVWFSGASMDAAVPLSEMNGMMTLNTAVRRGKLGGLRGTVQAQSLKIADRPARDLYAELFKPEKQDAMRIEKMQAAMAGGELAGQVDLAFPDNGPSRFAVGLVLRNADVTQLSAGTEGVKGQLTASLALEGAWNEPHSRRGRGDVTVTGRDMYHIPLVLGLMQITNLSLPLTSPFNEANARYMVDGQKVSFEQIELRASNMIMQGNGSLDYGTRKVNLTFTTDNPNWPKLPLVDELLKGAKHELLQIHVNGTIQEPKVSGSVMNTFTTTVDEVLRTGDSSHRKK